MNPLGSSPPQNKINPPVQEEKKGFKELGFKDRAVAFFTAIAYGLGGIFSSTCRKEASASWNQFWTGRQVVQIKNQPPQVQKTQSIFNRSFPKGEASKLPSQYNKPKEPTPPAPSLQKDSSSAEMPKAAQVKSAEPPKVESKPLPSSAFKQDASFKESEIRYILDDPINKEKHKGFHPGELFLLKRSDGSYSVAKFTYSHNGAVHYNLEGRDSDKALKNAYKIPMTKEQIFDATKAKVIDPSILPKNDAPRPAVKEGNFAYDQVKNIVDNPLNQPGFKNFQPNETILMKRNVGKDEFFSVVKCVKAGPDNIRFKIGDIPTTFVGSVDCAYKIPEADKPYLNAAKEKTKEPWLAAPPPQKDPSQVKAPKGGIKPPAEDIKQKGPEQAKAAPRKPKPSPQDFKPGASFSPSQVSNIIFDSKNQPGFQHFQPGETILIARSNGEFTLVKCIQATAEVIQFEQDGKKLEKYLKSAYKIPNQSKASPGELPKEVKSLELKAAKEKTKESRLAAPPLTSTVSSKKQEPKSSSFDLTKTKVLDASQFASVKRDMPPAKNTALKSSVEERPVNLKPGDKVQANSWNLVYGNGRGKYPPFKKGMLVFVKENKDWICNRIKAVKGNEITLEDGQKVPGRKLLPVKTPPSKQEIGG